MFNRLSGGINSSNNNKNNNTFKKKLLTHIFLNYGSSFFNKPHTFHLSSNPMKEVGLEK
jgi:hypothetical protein